MKIQTLIKIITVHIGAALIIFTPLFLFAEGVIYDCMGGLVCCSGPDCDFGAIKFNIEHIIGQTVKFAFLFISIMFAYAGYKYMTAQGDMGAIKEAHSMFINVIIGTLVTLLAFVIIKTITTSLGLTSSVLLLE